MIQGDSKLLVNQGQAGTGAAVIYDTNHFNPLQFTEELVSNIRTEKNKKIAEREKQNKALLDSFENPYEGMLFQPYFIDKVKGIKSDITKDPTLINDINDPTSALGKQYQESMIQLESDALRAKGIDELYNKDLSVARSPSAQANLDPQTYEDLKKVATMSPDEAYKFYQENGGTLIKPASDIEDLMTQMTLQPHGFDTKIESGQKLTTPFYDEDELDKEVKAIITNPQNAKNIEYQLRTYGSEDKLIEEMKRRARPKAKITNVTGSKSGGGGGGSTVFKNVTTEFFYDDKGEYNTEGEINAAKLSYNGKPLPPYTYTDDNNNPVFMQALSIKKAGKSYKIVGNEAIRTGEQKMTIEEATEKGLDLSKLVKTNEVNDKGEDTFVEIIEFKPREIYLNAANTAALKAQTGKNFWDEFKKLNNSIGKNKAKTEPAAKSPSKTSSGSSTSGKRDWSTNKRQ